MNDNNSNKQRGAAEERIDIERENEVREWSRSLGCSDAELLAAVEAVGNSVSNVREYLRRG